MNVVIFNHPACGTSRNAQGSDPACGHRTRRVDHLSHPPSRERLAALTRSLGLDVRQAIRKKGTPYREPGLRDASLGEEALLDTMLTHPILINQHFVQTLLGTRLCRPSEIVPDILPPVSRPFTMEGGEFVVDQYGNRLR